MADIQIPKMPAHTPCLFQMAWVGQCKKPSDNGWCTEHEKEKCVVCGKQATHSCDYTGSSPFVCGAKLCATCGHEPYIPNEVPFPSKHLNADALKKANQKASTSFEKS